jgi:drug/metabolite transporter (DMT)-like permease
MRIYILLVLCVLFWSGNFIIGRYVHEEISPISLALFRWIGAALLMLPFLIFNFSHIFKVFKENFLILSLLSILGISAFNTFLYIGLQDTTATNALLINSSIPVLILVFSFIILKIAINFKQFIGIVFSTFGVIFLIIKGDFSTLTHLQHTQGDIWVILSSLTWALYSTLVRFKPKALSDMQFFTTIVYIGLFWLGIAYVFVGGNFSKDIVHVKDFWWVFVYISLFTSVLSYYFWHQGIHTIGANKTGQFTHLMPLFGSILAYLFLKEHLMSYHIFGALFIAFGIYLSLFSKKEKR